MVLQRVYLFRTFCQSVNIFYSLCKQSSKLLEEVDASINPYSFGEVFGLKGGYLFD